ncbi:hypothetical protein DPMN_192105 [Dreissena polymorpha]|uniref:Uncharacterized protein n=1 Tax=Dreissena polymorpha TaxID=45954 RepID=A0A9D4BC87_DREPO|nr:hypothetical protein DPMN_192105 [Dreissena polymorpha]
MEGTQGVLKKKQGLSNHKSMQQEYRRIETLKKTQSDMKGDAIKIHAQKDTLEQKVAAMQSNTYNLQSRVQSMEGTQSDIISKTRTIETQFDETLLQIVGRIETLEKTQSDMNVSANKTQA